jgi:hypothetical protein
MAELAAAIISAIMWIGKTAYDQTVRVYARSHEELERIHQLGVRRLKRSVGCADPPEDDSGSDEPVPVVVVEKKPPVALVVIGAALVAHVIRRATK